MIKLWDAATGEFIQTLQGHSEGISDVAWSSDGEHLASASDDKTIRIWSLEEVHLNSDLTNSSSNNAISIFPASRNKEAHRAHKLCVLPEL